MQSTRGLPLNGSRAAQEKGLATACIFCASKADEVGGKPRWCSSPAAREPRRGNSNSPATAASGPLQLGLLCWSWSCRSGWRRPDRQPPTPAQVTVSTNHLVNTVHLLSAVQGRGSRPHGQERAQHQGQAGGAAQRSPHQPAAQQSDAPSSATAAGQPPRQPGDADDDGAAAADDDEEEEDGQATALVADDYYDAKKRLIQSEQVLLRVGGSGSSSHALRRATAPQGGSLSGRALCFCAGLGASAG
jgi:hypothetical protein